METPKEYHYTYYSYEKWGRGYFGSRTCRCLPDEDTNYFGSFADKTFRPTQKIILKSDYSTREEANVDEIILHNYYDVGNNPHFANQAKQTSIGFCYFPSKEWASENGKKNYSVGIGLFTKEQRSFVGKKSAETNKNQNKAVYGLTREQKSQAGKLGSKTINSQKWMCIETGFISTFGPLTRYQRKRGIDTSKRQRIS